MKYKEQVNTKTGAKRWVPAPELETTADKKKFTDFLGNIPFIGPANKVATAVGTGLAASIKTPMVQKQTMSDQMKALGLTKQAQQTSDPVLKKQLLDESRALSQGAGERASNYSNKVNENMPSFVSANLGMPTNTLKENINVYGAPSAKAALGIGSLLALGGAGDITKIGSGWNGFLGGVGRVGAKTGIGAGSGFLGGYLSSDTLPLFAEERMKNAEDSMAIGAVLGFGFGTASEGLRALKNMDATKIKNIVQKVNDKFNIFKRISKTGTDAATNQPFDHNALKESVLEKINSPENIGDSNKLIKEFNKNWVSTFGREAGIPGVSDPSTAETLLSARKGLDTKWGPGFIGKIVKALQGLDPKNSINNKYKQIVYQSINEQLHKIPGVSNSDAAIWLLNQIKDAGLVTATYNSVKKLF